MSPRSRRRSAAAAIAAIGLLMSVVLAACGSSFDPTGSCTSDGSKPGAYPELEAAVPTSFRGAAPSDLDSGRTCTKEGLGTLADHGVAELRFAGGTWSTGSESGVSLALFTDASGPPLDPAWVAEFYETGAKAGKNVTSVDASDYSVGDNETGRRIDVLNGESYQTVVVWQRGEHVAAAVVADAIRVIQTKDAHEQVVRDAVDALRP